MAANDAWNIIKKTALLMPPASRERISIANEELKTDGLPPIPGDYQDFLLKANGAQGPAFVLLGTEPQPMAGNDQADAIYEATMEFDTLEEHDGKLVLGWVSGNLSLIYDSNKQIYQLIDNSCGDILFTYDSITAFMLESLKRAQLA